MAAGTDSVDDTDEFPCDVTDGHAMMFVHLLLMAVIDFGKVRLMETCHAGSLIESGAQDDAAAFAHFDFAAPLATFAHAGVHAGIGQEGVEETMAGEAPQITEFGGDQRSGDRADARNSLMGCSMREKSLWM